MVDSWRMPHREEARGGLQQASLAWCPPFDWHTSTPLLVTGSSLSFNATSRRGLQFPAERLPEKMENARKSSILPDLSSAQTCIALAQVPKCRRAREVKLKRYPLDGDSRILERYRHNAEAAPSDDRARLGESGRSEPVHQCLPVNAECPRYACDGQRATTVLHRMLDERPHLTRKHWIKLSEDLPSRTIIGCTGDGTAQGRTNIIVATQQDARDPCPRDGKEVC